MLQIILNCIIPFILTTILGIIIKELKDNKNNNKAMQESMVLLLRSQITGKCEKYIELGYLPDYARSCIADLFKQYKILGGNHGVEKLVDLVFSLPPIKKGSD
ncbi:MAG: hypothetical protein HFH45_06500 [Bacilli bacterium]|nr:hypothetical protein [Bacilli bacterium]